MRLDPDEVGAVNPEVGLLLREGARFLPIMIPLTLTFDGTTGTKIGNSAESSLPVIGALTWVHRIHCTIERPNADAGSVLRGQNDYYTSMSPYIDIDMKVLYSPLSYVLTPTEIALAALVDSQINWLLRPNAAVTAKGFLTRDLDAAESPYKARLTLVGQQIDPTDALAGMIKKMRPDQIMRANALGGIAELERTELRTGS